MAKGPVRCVVLWFWLAGSLLPAAERNVDVEGLFEAGNRAYHEKNYPEAVGMYREILARGIQNGHVEFNLGNAYFRLGQLGEAILHYERAHRLLPRNRDILQNLQVARKQCEDQTEEEPGSAVVRFFSGISASYTADEWTTFASIGLFVLGGLITARTFCRGGATRRRLRHLAVLAGVVCVWSAANAAVQIYRVDQREAIIVVPEVKVYAEPNPSHESHLFLLHEGSKVRIQRWGGDWILVRYAAGIRGWCQAADVTEI